MRFTEEQASIEVVFTIGALQALQEIGWEIGYRKGFEDGEDHNMFDLTQNPWSEDNDDY